MTIFQEFKVVITHCLCHCLLKNMIFIETLCAYLTYVICFTQITKIITHTHTHRCVHAHTHTHTHTHRHTTLTYIPHARTHGHTQIILPPENTILCITFALFKIIFTDILSKNDSPSYKKKPTHRLPTDTCL